MPSPRRETSLPRTWFVTVRVLEAAALVLLAGAVLEVWAAFRSSGQFSPFGSELSRPSDLSPMQRIVAMAFFSGLFKAPLNALLAAVLLAVAVAVLLRAQPVFNAALLRWEVLAVWCATAVIAVGLVLLHVVAMFGDNPYANPVTGVVPDYAGPGLVEQALNGLSWPVAAAAVLGTVGLWWLRLPADVDGPDSTAEGAAPPLPRRRKRAQRTPAPSADVDDILLDGVEQIAPVERLEPRQAPSDGSTASGYDDYFRKF